MRIRFISHPDLMKKCCQEIKFKKYVFSRFQLYVLGECTYMDTTLLNLVPRAFPLKNGWSGKREIFV